MSPFEIIMLVCFGAAWPFSIHKSARTKRIGSKSLLFLFALLLGYVAGVLHKLFYLYDPVIFLYVLNGSMVAVDIGLYFRNRMYHIAASGREHGGDSGAGAEESNRSPGGTKHSDRADGNREGREQ